MVFKKDLAPLTRRGQVIKHKGKGAREQELPSRHAMNELTGGSPAQRSMQNYAKLTPDDEGAIPGAEPEY